MPTSRKLSEALKKMVKELSEELDISEAQARKRVLERTEIQPGKFEMRDKGGPVPKERAIVPYEKDTTFRGPRGERTRTQREGQFEMRERGGPVPEDKALVPYKKDPTFRGPKGERTRTTPPGQFELRGGADPQGRALMVRGNTLPETQQTRALALRDEPSLPEVARTLARRQEKTKKGRLGKAALGLAGAGVAGAGAYKALSPEEKEDVGEFIMAGREQEQPAADRQESVTVEDREPRRAAAPTAAEEELDVTQIQTKIDEADVKPLDQAEQLGEIGEEYKERLAEAYETYQQTKDQNARAALWEGIIQGLGHIAAGVYGQKTGQNLGGIEFTRTNWDRRAAQNLAQLREARQMAKDVRDIQLTKADREYKRNLDELRLSQQVQDRALRAAGMQARLEEAAKERLLERERAEQEALVDLAKQARKAGDDQAVDKIKRFQKIENRLDQLMKEFNRTGDEEKLQKARADVLEYQKLAEEIGIPSPIYTEEDLADQPGIFGASEPDPEEVEEKRGARRRADVARASGTFVSKDRLMQEAQRAGLSPEDARKRFEQAGYFVEK